MLHLRVLGDFSLIYHDQHLTTFSTARLRALLTYLILHRETPQQRQHLAFLFWPDATEFQARNNLRQLLYQLRQAFPAMEQFLVADSQTLYWHPTQPCSVDVAEYEQALALVDSLAQTDDQYTLRRALEQAAQLYGGELLPNCYDEWLLPERERLHQSHLRIFEQLCRLCETQGDTIAAIQYAQRLLNLDPLCEDYYRRLMYLFVLNNDRASALRVYHTCVTTLQHELGVGPDLATQAVYERLLQQEQPSLQQLHLHQRPLIAASTLIGREREWLLLQTVWQHQSLGEPHFVFVRGEAGVGKSRLTEEFVEWAGQQGAATGKARSYAAEGQLSFAPITEWLRSDDLRPKLGQLDRVWLTEIVRLLPELLEARPDLPHYAPVTEYGQRLRFFEALARAILVSEQPLLLLLDDLQWCDQETLEWLHFLLRFARTSHILIIGCAREEELPLDHPLRTFLLHLHNTVRVTEIELKPLDAAETGKLATQIAQRMVGQDEGLDLFRETGGYPLFIVEMVRAGVGREHEPTSEADHLPGQLLLFDRQTLPPRIYAVLVGRLRQLSASARGFVELAATVGREFSLDLLVACSNAEPESVVHALDELWQKRIVGEHSANTYDFTHGKLREVAYQEISAPQRRLLHQRIAHALETLAGSDLDLVSGQIGAHYERAGMIEQALGYYQRAASVAQRVYANQDAISLLLGCLSLVELLPPGTKRDKQELELQLALSPLYRVTKGWATPELERVLDRALALCDTVGDDRERAQTLYGLQSVYVVQAKLERVQMVSDELHLLYQRSHGRTMPPFAKMVLAGAKMHLGRIIEANAYFAQTVGAYDADQLVQVQESQGVNYAAHGLGWQAHALWCLGYPQQALVRGLEAVKLVQDLDQPFNEVITSAYLALLQQLRADAPTAKAEAERALELATRHQAPYYRTWADILVCYALALEHPDSPSITRLRHSIETFKASSARLRLPYYFSLLAQVCLKAGRVAEGLAAIDEGLAEARAHNERWWDAELHRLRGELLLMGSGDTADGEGSILRAIELARTQKAKSLELRATLSLAQVWLAQSREAEARPRLETIYKWFREGFDTPDLRTAQQLLARL